MQPYLTDIDATKNNIFSCVINSEGGTKITHYNLFINDLNSKQIYTSGKIELTTPLYGGNVLNITVPSSSGMINGNDYAWNIIIYENTPSIWVTYGVVQSGSSGTSIKIRKHFNVKNEMYIRIGSEIRKITKFDESTGTATIESAFSTTPSANTEYTIYSDFIESGDIYFKARSTPVVSITNVPNTAISNKGYEFLGKYTQSDNVAWKYYEFILYSSDGEIVETSGKISTGEIKYYFDGFLNNTSYAVELVVENQDGNITSTNKKLFSISYDEPIITLKPDAKLVCEKNAIQVTWKPYLNYGKIYGSASPQYEYVENEPYTGGSSLLLKDKCRLEYTPDTTVELTPIPYESTVNMHCTFPIGFEGDIVKMEDKSNGDFYHVSYKNGTFYYNINNVYVGKVVIQEDMTRWLLESKEDYVTNGNYVWDDNAVWDDNLFWSERETDIINEYWYKITLLPTKIIVTQSKKR